MPPAKVAPNCEHLYFWDCAKTRIPRNAGLIRSSEFRPSVDANSRIQLQKVGVWAGSYERPRPPPGRKAEPYLMSLTASIVP